MRRAMPSSLCRHGSNLNRDFRYQLTVIGQFAQAIVAVSSWRSIQH